MSRSNRIVTTTTAGLAVLAVLALGCFHPGHGRHRGHGYENDNGKHERRHDRHRDRHEDRHEKREKRHGHD